MVLVNALHDRMLAAGLQIRCDVVKTQSQTSPAEIERIYEKISWPHPECVSFAFSHLCKRAHSCAQRSHAPI